MNWKFSHDKLIGTDDSNIATIVFDAKSVILIHTDLLGNVLNVAQDLESITRAMNIAESLARPETRNAATRETREPY